MGLIQKPLPQYLADLLQVVSTTNPKLLGVNIKSHKCKNLLCQ